MRTRVIAAWATAGLLCVAAFGFAAYGSISAPAPEPAPTRIPIKRSPSVLPTRIALPDPGVSKATIIASVKQYPGVLDAAISQRGDQMSLVLIVHSATNESSARLLGDNFVRLYKSLSDDEPPGSSIGRGKYDYLIGVYYPNEKKVAQGAKSRASDRISW